MAKTTAQVEEGTVVVTYGELNEGHLKSIRLTSVNQAKELASQFIRVIPDELEWYEKEIKKWNGKEALVLSHQDDDTFYFSATVISAYTDPDRKPRLAGFHKFVSDNKVDDE